MAIKRNLKNTFENINNVTQETNREEALRSMKKLALETKQKYGGKRISYLLLEKETGIGRMTWKRKLEDFINQLNTPIQIETTLRDNENVTLPNIAETIERYSIAQKQLPSSLIAELLSIEQFYQSVYFELQKIKDKNTQFEVYKQKYDELLLEYRNLKTKADTYEMLYKKLVVSSAITHIREIENINHNLIDFEKNKNKNIGLKNLDEFFPNSQDLHESLTVFEDEETYRQSKETPKSKKMKNKAEQNKQILKNLVPNIFDD